MFYRRLPLIIGGICGLLLIGYSFRNHNTFLGSFSPIATPNPTSTNATIIGEDNGGEIIPISGSGANVFRSTKHNFSFRYPNGYTVGSFKEGDAGEVLLVQKKEGGATGFEIYSTPFEEDVTITPERIREDLPSIVIKNPQTITLGLASRARSALSFQGSDPTLGDTAEVWFLWSGRLYQIRGDLSVRQVMQSVLETWQFE